MRASSGTRVLGAILSTLAVSGCAAFGSGSGPTSQVSQPALVVGTFSSDYLQPASGEPWRVRLERVDAAPEARREYVLTAELDRDSQRGVFSGMLPPGVYAFQQADNAGQHFGASGMAMPVEVQPGEVQDLGHYALNPLTPR